MRYIAADMSPKTVAAIDARLDDIVARHGVTIPLAIESGSRAWGFPSPDSDYDCRFVYVRAPGAYLTPWPLRDVIETPIEGDLDVNGWDLAKALQLMLNGNAVIIEWLQSPITYRDHEAFRAAFLQLATQFSDRTRIARHYYNFGQQLMKRHLSDPEQVILKKLFYVLRPVAALRWMRLYPEEALPPMHFPTLLAASDLPAGLQGAVDRLLSQKAKTRELGTGPIPHELRAFIDTEFGQASELANHDPRPKEAGKAEATKFFQSWVHQLAS